MSTKRTPGPWQVKGDQIHEDALTIIGNVDGEYLDGAPHCTFDVVAQCVDEYGAFIPSAYVKALEAATGYLLNAKVDLETGCTKATAIKTIEGGLVMARAALAKATAP
jgi:hypothetical protein